MSDIPTRKEGTGYIVTLACVVRLPITYVKADEPKSMGYRLSAGRV
jgi:hypothetical protein